MAERWDCGCTFGDEHDENCAFAPTKDCPCPPPFKDVAYCPDCPYRTPEETA